MTDRADPNDRLDRIIDEVVRTMMAHDGPADLHDRVLARIAGPEAGARRPAWARPLLRPFQIGLAAAAALVVVAVFLWWPGGAPPTRSAEQAPGTSSPIGPARVARGPAAVSPSATASSAPFVTADRAASDPSRRVRSAQRSRFTPRAAAGAPTYPAVPAIEIAPVSARLNALELDAIVADDLKSLALEEVEIKAVEVAPLPGGGMPPPTPDSP